MEEQTGLNLDKEAVQSRDVEQKELEGQNTSGLFLKEHYSKDYTEGKEEVFHQSYDKVDYATEKQNLFSTVYEYPSQNTDLNKRVISYILIIIISIQLIFIIFKIITRRKTKS